jgi:hypothetical protein
MLRSNNNSLDNSVETQRDKERFELDEVQQHFQSSNEMLVDGIPFSRWLKIQELKKQKEQKEEKNENK